MKIKEGGGMDIQELIDFKYEEIEGLKLNLSEDHHMNPEQEDELEELIAQAIKFGELCAKRDAKAQAVPEGFVEKTESNTHHYFKLKDWNEWSCIDVIKDAITSDYDINSIVEVEQLEVVEIQQSTKYGLLRFAKRHGDEVVFFDSLEEAQQAQEPAND